MKGKFYNYFNKTLTRKDLLKDCAAITLISMILMSGEMAYIFRYPIAEMVKRKKKKVKFKRRYFTAKEYK